MSRPIYPVSPDPAPALRPWRGLGLLNSTLARLQGKRYCRVHGVRDRCWRRDRQEG